MKRAIVIGASSGIGFEMSRLLIGKGWTVAVAARRSERLEPLRLLAPERVIPIALDVNQDAAPEQLHELITRLGGIELYIHTAGIGRQNRLLDADIENRTAETNVGGFTRMVGEAFRYMAEHGGGHIAVISSIAGTKGLGPAPAYSATKAFQATYIQSLEQLANSRKLPINFTDIRPGFADTG